MSPKKIIKPKIEVDFNELIGDSQILLSQTNFKKDVYGKDVFLTEGLEIEIFEVDYDDYDKRDDIVASGYVTQCKNPLYKHVKWCCKIDSNWIRHLSDL
jgi:hypothetical protein